MPFFLSLRIRNSAAVFPAVSSRCFTYLFPHLHPLPTHLPLKGLPVVFFSFYSTLLLSLNSLFSQSVKHSGGNVLFLYFIWSWINSKNLLLGLLFMADGYWFWQNKRLPRRRHKSFTQLSRVKAGGWYCDHGAWPVASGGRKKAASPFTFLLFIVRMWNLFHTYTFSVFARRANSQIHWGTNSFSIPEA